MSINRGRDEEDVAHIYNGILLSHEQEQHWVICRDVNGPRDYHTKSVRGKKNTVCQSIYMESRKMIQINLFATCK